MIDLISKLVERGLAYRAEVPVWWCPQCGTVLANEEVVEGACERKGHPVERRPMRQWMLKITAYADRLLSDLESLDWPGHIKAMQRHWIGKSEGAEVWFSLSVPSAAISETLIDGVRVRRHEGQVQLKIYTTRPDTLFGATYMVLAPEHPLVSSITPESRRLVVEDYCKSSSTKSELERTELTKQKTGVFTGAYAINPVNQEKIPIWIADYVLASYGTGAIMAVPAHDQRDLEFALQYGLDIRIVIVPEDTRLELVGMTEAYVEPGRMHESGPFTGLHSDEAAAKIVEWLHAKHLGQRAVQYKLRDWLFSRQRYWGEPIPIVHCQRCGTVPLPESALPLLLPEMDDFKPTGTALSAAEQAPLAKATDWVQTTCPRCRGAAQRETNTMPQWAGSCWYYLRYLDPRNDRRAWDADLERYWMPVDLYVGGAEHAVLHLLYARFWHKVLYDLRLVSTSEPFQKLVNQGLILGEDGEKMSKSRGNVINPDDVIDQHGADAFRLYEMFMGPLEAVKPWSTRGIEGIDRFLQRVWRLVVTPDDTVNPAIQDVPISDDLHVALHRAIYEVTEDVEPLRFNTAIAHLMVFANRLSDESVLPRKALETFLLLLAPFAPHLAEELWQRLGHPHSLATASWPSVDPAALEQAEVVWVIQVNGKVRGRLTLPAELSEDQLRQAALADDNVKRYVDNHPIQQVIVVPKRLVNIVVSDV